MIKVLTVAVYHVNISFIGTLLFIQREKSARGARSQLAIMSPARKNPKQNGFIIEEVCENFIRQLRNRAELLP